MLASRAFGVPERLVPKVEDVAWIALAIDDGAVTLSVSSGGQQVLIADFGADGWTDPSGTVHPYGPEGYAVIEFRDTEVRIGEQPLPRCAPGRIELAPKGTVSIDAIELRGSDGSVLLSDTFGTPVAPGARLLWTGIGLAMAGLLGLGWNGARTTSERRLLCALALLPAVPLALTYPAWVALTERLYLGGIDLGTLRAGALAVAAAPLFARAVLWSPLLAPDRSERLDRRRRLALGSPVPALLLAAASALAASRDLEGWRWVLAPLGIAFLALPWAVGRATAQLPVVTLVRDLPALAVLAALGWEKGLLPAAVWRLVALSADARLLLRRGARVGADAFLALLILLPLSAELLIRATPLDHAWDADVLAGASAREAGFGDPFWTEACAAGGTQNVLSFGGSSTGGAWQFAGDASAFFPARLHRRLCDAGMPVRSFNYGDSGRDTWDIARAAPAVFAEHTPAAVILYVGVNDVLTQESPLTRKEQAARLEGRGASLIARVAGSSRLLNGLSLLVRPRDAAELVTAVPLADAEENLRAIVAAAETYGARVLLVAEAAQGVTEPDLVAYGDLVQRLGNTLPAADGLDARQALGPAWTSLLSDRNHLTPAGADALAAALAPSLYATLSGTTMSGAAATEAPAAAGSAPPAGAAVDAVEAR